MSTILLNCNHCNKEFEKELKEYKRQSKNGRNVFYCTQGCASIHSNKNRVLSDETKEKLRQINLGNTYGKKGDFTKILRSSRQKRYSELNEIFLQELWEKQNGKCAISGVVMTKQSYSTTKTPWMVTIDRIDSSKNYTQDNVQLVAYSINCAKNDFTDDQFREFISEITNR